MSQRYYTAKNAHKVPNLFNLSTHRTHAGEVDQNSRLSSFPPQVIGNPELVYLAYVECFNNGESSLETRFLYVEPSVECNILVP